ARFSILRKGGQFAVGGCPTIAGGLRRGGPSTLLSSRGRKRSVHGRQRWRRRRPVFGGTEKDQEARGGLGAMLRALGHHPFTDGSEPVGHGGIERADLRGRRLGVLEDALDQSPFGKGGFAGQHVKERAAQGIQIAADVGGTAVAGLLGGHVID